MMRSLRCGLLTEAVLGLALLILSSVPATAQQDILTGQPFGGAVGQPGGDFVGGDTPETVVSVTAHFTAPTAGQPAILSVTAQIAPPWYTYSTTQKPIAATPTQLGLNPSDDYRLAGDFRSMLPPKIVKDGNYVFEEFAPEVTWQAPIELRDGVKLEDLKITGKAHIQVCKIGTCLSPTDFEFTAQLAKSAPAASGAAPSGIYAHPNIHATLHGHLEPAQAAPGSTVNLVITAEMPKGWHVYQWTATDKGDLGYKPTVIGLANTGGFPLKQTEASQPPVEAPSVIPGEPVQKYYEGRVTWTTPIVIPKEAKPGFYTIEGAIGYQTCLKDRCDLPRGAGFSGAFQVAATTKSDSVPLTFSDAKYGEAAKLAAAQPAPINAGEMSVKLVDGATASSLPLIILAGLLGGFILNFMPCVLPVIGLKVLSFAEQGGRSRAQVLALNLWYAAGTLLVFMVLATLAAAVSLGISEKSLGWGEQFTYTWFNIAMVALVFVMALSFLGIWEIPIPGFVGSGKATKLAAREGAGGAFAKGVMATVLATPCSGPALGPVFGYTLNQPASVTYLLFFCIALGMSAPYLIIGAFPRLIQFIPKPGAWMDTFKNMMGFVLLGTIVFLMSAMDKDYLVPTFCLMVGLWAACWWIGRTPLYESAGRKAAAWAQGTVVAAAVGWFAFAWLAPHPSIIPWQPFSQAELARLRDSGNTVLVDFTADWCLTCKANLLLAIETKDVRDAIAENKVVPLLADWTKGSPEIKETLASLQSNSIPLLAIFPAGNPDKPIVLRDVITKQQLLDAIKEASEGKTKLTAAAR